MRSNVDAIVVYGFSCEKEPVYELVVRYDEITGKPYKKQLTTDKFKLTANGKVLFQEVTCGQLLSPEVIWKNLFLYKTHEGSRYCFLGCNIRRVVLEDPLRMSAEVELTSEILEDEDIARIADTTGLEPKMYILMRM